MGLDMYLTAKRYFWKHGKDSENKIAEKVGALIPEVKGLRASRVEFDVGYWRKANAIHKWFVDNTQEGNDDCRDSYVEKEQLLELKKLCQEVLKDKKKAPELLPTQSGFFFGGEEYDEYYFKDLQDTIKIIEIVESLPDELDFYYGSSW